MTRQLWQMNFTGFFQASKKKKKTNKKKTATLTAIKRFMKNPNPNSFFS